MRISSLTAVAVGAAATSATTTNFTVKAVQNPDYTINLLTTYAGIYAKYNVTFPESLITALQAQAQAQQDDDAALLRARGTTTLLSGDATAIPSRVTSGQYLCTVDIGTPPQRFLLNLDTGSADAWVYSSSLPASFLNGQRTYNHKNSSTSRIVPWEIWLTGYVDFTFVGGLVYTDTMTVVGEEKDTTTTTSQQQLTVAKQGVQVAHIVSRSIVKDNADMDGILGLGFDSKNFAFPVKQKTWFSNIRDRLSEALFTVNFRHKKSGEYTFGHINQNVGPITYTPVDSSAGYWTWTSTGYAIGSSSSSSFKPLAMTGTVDTGTTIIMLPPDVVTDYYAAVPGAAYSNADQGYIFDCDAALPDFTFGVEQSRIRIPGPYLNASVAVDSAGAGKCAGGIQSGGAGNLVIFGAPALEAGVVVFDAGNLRLGWANKTLEV